MQNFPLFSWNFAKFNQILLKFCVLQNLHNAVSQQPYVEVEEEEGGEWGGGPARTALRTLPAKAEWAYIGVHL